MRLDVLKAAGGEFLRLGRLVCAKCDASNAGDARTCQACGQGLYVRCVACGEENRRVRSRCRGCGFYIRRTLAKRLKQWAATRPGRCTLGVLVLFGIACVTVKGILLVIQLDGGG